MSAELEFEKLIKRLAKSHDAVVGQMFGKRCIKAGGKAAIALFKDCLVFKLPPKEHESAMKLSGSVFWDPSRKGRGMKEWVQIDLAHKVKFRKLAKAACSYVAQ